jgi:hypothetical protein
MVRGSFPLIVAIAGVVGFLESSRCVLRHVACS